MMRHVAVLLDETVSGLNIIPGGIYIDATFGGGGHSAEIAKRLSGGKLVTFDKDNSVQVPENQIPAAIMIHDDFRNISKHIKRMNPGPVSGIIADLGISSIQLDNPSRGFSYRFDSPLDMRFSLNTEVTASVVINTYSEKELLRVFRTYGELPLAGPFVRLICRNREKNPIETTFALCDLARIIFIGKNLFNRLSRIFQALRIEVNDELNALREFLLQCPDLMNMGARLCIITYHSLEDRLVKNYFAKGNFSGESSTDLYGNILRPLKPVTMRPVLPSVEEVQRNPRARSAKLRIAEKI